MKRVCALLILSAALLPAAFTEAVEFPYTQFPRQLWERELAWLKNTGIRTISIPEGGDPALREALVALLRRLELSALPATEHFARIPAMAPNNLALSRGEVIAGHHGVIWTGVETTLTPQLQMGAVALSGEDAGPVNGLRRDARMAQFWAPLFAPLEKNTALTATGITAHQLKGRDASAVLLINNGARAWSGQLRVAVASMSKTLMLPVLSVAPGDSLWLPVDVPLASGAFCKQCSAFGNADRLVYSTLELSSLEFENGTLALEFYAPVEGEAVLQIAKHPTGPYLAGGRLKSFDWDNATSRARIVIPPGKAPLFRTRVALAIEAPEQSAFFSDAKRLLIGEINHVLTSYSSEEIAQRSRLKLPPGWTATAAVKSPLEIEYTIAVPSSLVHGDHVDLALEADGVEMSRARVTVLRPVSIRVPDGISLHFGKDQSLPVVPALVPVETPAGRTLTLAIRNGSAEIRTYTIAIDAPGLEFSPAQLEVVVGALAEREVSVRVFAKDALPDVVQGTVKVSGASSLMQPIRFIAIPRGQTARYSTQLDGVEGPEFVLETARVRAVFSSADGGRWMELVWKESGRNLLGEKGVALAKSEIDLHDNVLTIAPAIPNLKLETYSDVEARIENTDGKTVLTLTRPAK